MKHIGLSFLFIFFTIPFNSVFAIEAGIIKTVSGNVMIQRNQAKIAARKGMHLDVHDVLSTGANSTVGIIFTDGTVFTIGPDSKFEMQNYEFEPDTKSYDFSIFLKQGTAIYNSGKISKLAPEAIDIETPKATVGIRGTRLIISVD